MDDAGSLCLEGSTKGPCQEEGENCPDAGGGGILFEIALIARKRIPRGRGNW